MDDALLLYGGLGASAVVFLLFLCWMCRHEGRLWSKHDLKKPLITDADSREDEAQRVAEGGTISCAGCGFDNFRRLAFCAMCIAPLGEDEKTRQKHAKQRKKQPPVLQDPKLRQSRVQRRREWTRKTDVNGQLFWFRSAVLGQSPDAMQPGFIPILKSTAGAIAPVATLSIKDRLENETTSLDVQFVTATTNSPESLVFPLGQVVALTESTRSALDVAHHKDFATKYAEVVRRTTALSGASSPALDLPKQHADNFHASMTFLAGLNVDKIQTPLVVRNNSSAFNQLQGINTHREWLNKLTQTLVRHDVGLFSRSIGGADDETTYCINPQSKTIVGDDHLRYFYAVGRLIGRALALGDLLPFHLAMPLRKILLAQPLSFHDLEHGDPAMYKQLKSVLESGNVESLGLTFSVVSEEDGTTTVDLIENGRHIAVTESNKADYVTRCTQYALVGRVSAQLYALCSGFYDVIPLDVLLLLDAEELDYVLCGSDDIDVDEWAESATYDSFLAEHPARRYFFDAIREMPITDKRRTLRLFTGSPRVPLSGFAGLTTWGGRLGPFSMVHAEVYNCQTIESQPAWNRVKLPLYITRKDITTRLHEALGAASTSS